jgi:quercetin dioxygenase-like cupin family protein
VKRHPALVPLSHDHDHALVQARRIVRAADTAETASVAAELSRFFHHVTVRHIREEEEALFPLVADSDDARPLIVQALLEHQRLHALVARLEGAPEDGAIARELGHLLQAHIGFEERELFPLIERLVGSELEFPDRDGETEGGSDRAGGPVWVEASEDLNATVLVWAAGQGPPPHVNGERDVLIVVLDGSATLLIDDDERELVRGDILVVEKGRRRAITAGPEGARYVSVHLRRPPLQIQPRLDPG